jgi:hypothetical protein
VYKMQREGLGFRVQGFRGASVQNAKGGFRGLGV